MPLILIFWLLIFSTIQTSKIVCPAAVWSTDFNNLGKWEFKWIILQKVLTEHGFNIMTWKRIYFQVTKKTINHQGEVLREAPVDRVSLLFFFLCKVNNYGIVKVSSKGSRKTIKWGHLCRVSVFTGYFEQVSFIISLSLMSLWAKLTFGFYF